MDPLVTRIDTPAALAPHLSAWDALAVAAGRPYCAPAWMLSWWRHAAPAGALLRTLVLVEGDELVAIGPFYARRTMIGPLYELLGSSVAGRIEPLALPGREEEAARAFTHALSKEEPLPAAVHFHLAVRGSPWPELFRRSWPGKVRVIGGEAKRAPTVSLAGRDFDAYIAAREAKLRGKLRRHRRRLEEHGARYRLLDTHEEVRRGLADFARLHYGRWEDRGGSGALNPRIERMLEDVEQELLDDGRFRLFAIEIDGRTISAQLFIAAGGEVGYWLGGFDPEWARYGPGNQGVLAAVKDGLERGERRVDLGPGAQEYKLRLADGEDALESLTLVTRPGRYPLARGLGLAQGARVGLAAHVPEPVKQWLRRVHGRAARRLPLRPERGGGYPVEVAIAQSVMDRQTDQC
jgi:CelD/BcsL family acetyltransferase involved in cellulose biosynthesis